MVWGGGEEKTAIYRYRRMRNVRLQIVVRLRGCGLPATLAPPLDVAHDSLAFPFSRCIVRPRIYQRGEAGSGLRRLQLLHCLALAGERGRCVLWGGDNSTVADGCPWDVVVVIFCCFSD